ncbi:prepilin-type N-terminal cleavage/methylation domain-containing protein [bacterium]|nr:prepilin-type N-terminal cleavage/methylation domain-containing protein [bacterium]
MKNKKAFTLVELIITLALCALVVTLTVVNVSFFNRSFVRSEVDALHMACMYLQQSALTTGKSQTLEIDVEKNCYSFDGRTKKLLSSVVFGASKNLKGPPSSPQKLIASVSTFKKSKIVFSPDGIISSGTIYIADRDKKITYALSSGIAQISHLRKYHYNKKWVLLE